MADIKNYLSRLQKIFHQKDWFRLFEYTGFDEKLTSFIEIIEESSEEEADLLLTLTEEYLYVDANTMQNYFLHIYNDISIELISSFKEIYILPLISPDNNQDTKSQSSVLYPAYHQLQLMCRHSKIDQDFKIESKDSMDALDNDLKNRKDCLIIFVDDFIGTGRSALKALSSYEKYFKRDTDVVAVMCAVCQEEGSEKLKKQGFDVWSHDVRKKGISDSNKITEVEKAIKVMSGISARVISNRQYHLGYRSSEALVTMPFRTPNNTFPIYWADNGTRTAPFYR